MARNGSRVIAWLVYRIGERLDLEIYDSVLETLGFLWQAPRDVLLKMISVLNWLSEPLACKRDLASANRMMIGRRKISFGDQQCKSDPPRNDYQNGKLIHKVQ